MEYTDIVNQSIRTRRSIYTGMFSGEEVDDHIISIMLENANYAPTHKLTEPWRFTIFKGEGLNKLADFQSNLYKEVSQANGDFKEDKFIKLKEKPLTCSHIIAIGMKRHDQVPEMEEVSAVAAAVQNMWITASAYKIGCYWSTGGVTFYEEAKPFFNLGSDDKLMGFLFLGMPKTDSWPKARRKPIEDKVTWVP
ncbi:MAG: nitroreductase [Bacteroidota bacterium]